MTNFLGYPAAPDPFFRFIGGTCMSGLSFGLRVCH